MTTFNLKSANWQYLGIKSQKIDHWALIIDLDLIQLICSRLRQFYDVFDIIRTTRLNLDLLKFIRE